MHLRRLPFILLIICLALPGFKQTHASEPQLILNGQTFMIELAVSAEERSLGLQHRTQLAANAGMLFVYSQPHMANFWMKNTHIPLDILFFNDAAELVHYHDHVPPCKAMPCPQYPSLQPIHYVLELNAGMRQKHGISLGHIFEIKQ